MKNNHTKQNSKQHQLLGDYIIQETLGKGTFGKVKLGIYIPSQAKVAIKILEKSRLREKDDLERVIREMEIIKQFNHNNVIQVYEILEDSSKYYIIMEFCEGGELFNHIVKKKRLSEEETSYYFYQMINGLEHIHSYNIVHRDLKPENLLLTKDRKIKIIDFGLSNMYSQGGKFLATPCGSPCYASPEMVSGKKYNGFMIDIWSCGIILYAMLCGYLPFEDPENEKLFQKILECNLVLPNYLSSVCKDLMKKILVTDPEKRIKIAELKRHPFYLQGRSLFKKEHKTIEHEIALTENNETAQINNKKTIEAKKTVLNVLTNNLSNNKPENILSKILPTNAATPTNINITNVTNNTNNFYSLSISPRERPIIRTSNKTSTFKLSNDYDGGSSNIIKQNTFNSNNSGIKNINNKKFISVNKKNISLFTGNAHIANTNHHFNVQSPKSPANFQITPMKKNSFTLNMSSRDNGSNIVSGINGNKKFVLKNSKNNSLMINSPKADYINIIESPIENLNTQPNQPTNSEYFLNIKTKYTTNSDSKNKNDLLFNSIDFNSSNAVEKIALSPNMKVNQKLKIHDVNFNIVNNTSRVTNKGNVLSMDIGKAKFLPSINKIKVNKSIFPNDSIDFNSNVNIKSNQENKVYLYTEDNNSNTLNTDFNASSTKTSAKMNEFLKSSHNFSTNHKRSNTLSKNSQIIPKNKLFNATFVKIKDQVKNMYYKDFLNKIGVGN